MIDILADLEAHFPALRSSAVARHLLRLRYQLIAILFLAVLLPSFFRGNFSLNGLTAGNNFETMCGLAVATVSGYFFHRRLTGFPGVLSSSYVIPSFAASFGVVMMAYFFLRLDYTRSTFAAGFVIATSTAYVMNILWMRANPTRLAVVPFGEVAGLGNIKTVLWYPLKDRILQQKMWDGVVVDLRADLAQEWERFIADTALAGTPVYHVKQIRESLTGRVEIERLAENTLGSLNPNQIYLKLKQAVDWTGAAFVLFLMCPMFILVCLAIKTESSGPALFTQVRRGYRGQNFRVFKFRTMRVDVSAGDGPLDAGSSQDEDDSFDHRRRAITTDNDDRITRIGQLLRKTRIDELPQVFNILRGEMSWIGPRPEALVLSQWYESELPFYSYRHIVKPGISGWAQVNQGHVAEVDQVLEKLHYDFYYIKNFSFWLDLLIVLRTVRTMLTGAGAR